MKSIDPSIKIDVQYLTEDPNDGKTGFENPTGGKDAATAMYEAGADVVYHAAGKSGLGVFDAVEAAGDGKWAIGVDSDQYLTVDDAQKPHILTSMLKRIDTAVFDYVKANADKDVTAGFVSYDLKSTAWATRSPAVSSTTSPTRSTRRPTRSRAARSSFRPTRPRSSRTRQGRASDPSRHRQYRLVPGRRANVSPGHLSSRRQEGP